MWDEKKLFCWDSVVLLTLVCAVEIKDENLDFHQVISYFSAFYLMYAKLEEDHGLARHAMAIYERATKAVLPEEQFEVGFLVHKKYINATNILMPLLMLTFWFQVFVIF